MAGMIREWNSYLFQLLEFLENNHPDLSMLIKSQEDLYNTDTTFNTPQECSNQLFNQLLGSSQNNLFSSPIQTTNFYNRQLSSFPSSTIIPVAIASQTPISHKTGWINFECPNCKIFLTSLIPKEYSDKVKCPKCCKILIVNIKKYFDYLLAFGVIPFEM